MQHPADLKRKQKLRKKGEETKNGLGTEKQKQWTNIKQTDAAVPVDM